MCVLIQFEKSIVCVSKHGEEKNEKGTDPFSPRNSEMTKNNMETEAKSVSKTQTQSNRSENNSFVEHT